MSVKKKTFSCALHFNDLHFYGHTYNNNAREESLHGNEYDIKL